ncbi:MAG: pyridoxamine 5'-phosphate oxidase family protein [Vicinamibacterales bacterium]
MPTRVVACIASVVVLTTGVRAAAPTRDEILKAARSVIAEARYATFVTIDEAGQPQSRVVDPFEPESDFIIWIGTNALTRKVAHLAANPRVTLLYFDRARQSYVAVNGTAAVVGEVSEKAKHWKDAWKAFYKDAYRGDDYVVIRVTPAHLEIVAEPLGMKSDPTTWRPVSLDFK